MVIIKIILMDKAGIYTQIQSLKATKKSDRQGFLCLGINKDNWICEHH